MEEVLTDLKGAAFMSTEPCNWQSALDATSTQLGSRCLFGVHPWFAHKYFVDQGWLQHLKARLTSTVGSAVGEIGLDKQWRTPDTGRVEYMAQLELFKVQFALAAELQLPVSIHCVRAQGDLQALLQSAPQLPPTIYLHAFGGARGTVEQLVRSKRYGERLYFGFASCINLRSPKAREAIRSVPDDRLLVESDRSSAADPLRIRSELIHMLQVFADIKGWGGGIKEAIGKTAQNAHRFYAPADQS